MPVPAVTLRPVILSDAENIAELNQNATVAEWLEGCTTPDRCKESIEAWTRMMRGDVEWYYTVLDAKQHFIGFCTVIREDEDTGSYHLTIALGPASRGKGYGTAAVTELVKVIKQKPQVKSLVAVVEDGNSDSRKLFLSFDANPTNELVEKALRNRRVKEWRYRLY